VTQEVLGYVYLVLAVAAIGKVMLWSRRADREMRERWRLRDEKLDRDDTELRAMRCHMWRSIGDDAHRANCQHCAKQRRRAQA
jgi:hypothetical protein